MEGRNYYVFQNGRIRRKENTIAFEYWEYEEGERKKVTRRIPVKQIESIYLFGEVSLNTKFLVFLSQEEILLHVFNYYGFYVGSYFPKKSRVSGLITALQAKFYWDLEKRIKIAKSFLEGCFFHMLRNLREYKVNEDIIEKIQKQKEKLKREDIYEVEYYLGIEGSVWDLYYQAWKEIIKDDDFLLEKREKRPPSNPINALISFGNSLLYTVILNELYKTQLDPTISFLHALQSKRFSLCLDLAEIFRPLIVDPVIFTLVNNRMLYLEDFDREMGYAYLKERGRKKFIELFERKLATTIYYPKLKKKVSYKFLIRLECYKLMKYFLGEEEYKVLKAWW